MTTKPTASKERAIRTYRLDIKPKDGGDVTSRLVNAKTDRGAITHVIDQIVTCRPATAQDGVELGKLGVEIESAGDSDEAPQAADGA